VAQKLYRIGEIDNVHVAELFLSQTLDAMEFDQINDGILKAIDAEAGGQWIVDLSAAKYIGSAVLGLLVNIRQRIKQAHGGLVLCGLSPRLEEIFQACCMERLFVIVKSRGEAVERVRR
jgi:anti-anti-sigma factor